MSNPKWLEWAQNLSALARAGLTYTENPFDLERYHKIQEIAAEILASYTDVDQQIIATLLDSQTGYTTPKVDVRGVIFQNERILLVKELADGGWTLPGGWVDVNEPPSRAAEREVWEESGYQVRAFRLLGIYDRNQHGFTPYFFHIYKIFIECELLGGEPTNSIETGGAAFYGEDEIPELSVGRTTPQILTRMFELHRQPTAPADFD